MMKINPVKWSKTAAEVLKKSVTHCTVEDIERQVKAGAQLFRVSCGAAVVGYYVLRIDVLANHSEAVLVAGAGRHADFDLIASVVPHIEKQFSGCKFLRVHTARPGLVKKLSAMNYEAQELVMRKAL